MPTHDREYLKAKFADGAGTVDDYQDLIDSTLNIVDDGMEVHEEHGLIVNNRPNGIAISIKNPDNDNDPVWNLKVSDAAALQVGANEINVMEFGQEKVQVKTGLSVEGTIGVSSWKGEYAKGFANADGNWHTIEALRDLSSCQAFEVFAHINDEDDKRYALTKATLLMSNGLKGQKKEVASIQAGSSWLWGKFFNKIKFKWVLDEDASKKADKERYMVQIKTRTHYGAAKGKPKQIFYRITKLWDKSYEQTD